MNTLEEYFFNNKNKKLKVHKWHHYFKIYDRHFKKFIGTNPTILEIGVFKGGSLEMWNHYFNNECTLYGVDIDPNCKSVSEKLGTDNIHIHIGSQDDRNFWKKFNKETPKFDIIIDDGGHTMKQQIVTFECMYDRVKDNGVYLCEDVHTSYWPNYGGGLKKETSFIEYSKNFIDKLNAYHHLIYNTKKLDFRKKTNSIHYYDSIVVLEKELDLEVPVATIK